MDVTGKFRPAVLAALLAFAALPGAAAAQEGAPAATPGGAGASASGANVADIRAELALLNQQIQEIRNALVASGPAQGLPQGGATALQRLDQLEARLVQLTGRVDVLANDLDRVVRDASNRVDDIEFRLTELEGGDVSFLGSGEPLGGGISERQADSQPVIPPVSGITGQSGGDAFGGGAAGGSGISGFPTPSPRPGTGAPQLAVGEKADFETAKAAYEEGRHDEAVRRLDEFLAAYPVGPFSAEAQTMKADALAAKGDHRAAARAYLDTFSGAPDAPTAPRALHGLATSLGRLGQTEEACLTLAEIDARYPGSAVASDVTRSRSALGCR